MATFVADRRRGGAAQRPRATESIQAVTADLYGLLATQPGNLVCSPYSVAVGLAMARNGARGRTANQMDGVLHAPPLSALNAGLNSLTQVIESRAGLQQRADGSEATLSLDVANSVWGQPGTPWEPPYLEQLALYYGAGIRLVDFERHTERARDLINEWTAERTADRITKIVPEGVLDERTRMVLVNAIALKAPWEEPFEPSQTLEQDFAVVGGPPVTAQMMSGELQLASYGRGVGWQAARLPYAGGKVAMTVVVPDSSLGELEQRLDASALAAMMTRPKPVPLLSLRLPRWRFRVSSSMREHLIALGMPLAFDDVRADFSAMDGKRDLYMKAVLHQAFIAVDEKGTEASAATAVVMGIESAPVPVQLAVDRPFLFVIHDVETATPLFIGRVSDPTA